MRSHPIQLTALILLTCMLGCHTTPPDPAASYDFVEQNTPPAPPRKQTELRRGSVRQRTQAYWNQVARDFHPCVAFATGLHNSNVSGGLVQAHVLQRISKEPVRGVDPDAVKAISGILTLGSSDQQIWSGETTSSVIKTANQNAPLLTSPNNGQFGDSLSGAGVAIGNSITAAVDGVSSMKALRRRVDDQLESTRRLLEAKYDDEYQPIQLAQNSCFSIKL